MIAAGLIAGLEERRKAAANAGSADLGTPRAKLPADRRASIPQSIYLARVRRLQPAGLPILSLDRFVDLLPVHRNLDRRRDPQANLVAPDIDYGNDDVITDNNAFISVAGQHEHRSGSFLLPTCEARDRP
jgi:hypothetical protein